MALHANPDPEQKRDDGTLEETLRDYTLAGGVVSVSLSDQAQAMPYVDEEELLVATFCEV